MEAPEGAPRPANADDALARAPRRPGAGGAAHNADEALAGAPRRPGAAPVDADAALRGAPRRPGAAEPAPPPADAPSPDPENEAAPSEERRGWWDRGRDKLKNNPFVKRLNVSPQSVKNFAKDSLWSKQDRRFTLGMAATVGLVRAGAIAGTGGFDLAWSAGFGAVAGAVRAGGREIYREFDAQNKQAADRLTAARAAGDAGDLKDLEKEIKAKELRARDLLAKFKALDNKGKVVSAAVRGGIFGAIGGVIGFEVKELGITDMIAGWVGNNKEAVAGAMIAAAGAVGERFMKFRKTGEISKMKTAGIILAAAAAGLGLGMLAEYITDGAPGIEVPAVAPAPHEVPPASPIPNTEAKPAVPVSPVPKPAEASPVPKAEATPAPKAPAAPAVPKPKPPVIPDAPRPAVPKPSPEAPRSPVPVQPIRPRLQSFIPSEPESPANPPSNIVDIRSRLPVSGDEVELSPNQGTLLKADVFKPVELNQGPAGPNPVDRLLDGMKHKTVRMPDEIVDRIDMDIQNNYGHSVFDSPKVVSIVNTPPTETFNDTEPDIYSPASLGPDHQDWSAASGKAEAWVGQDFFDSTNPTPDPADVLTNAEKTVRDNILTEIEERAKNENIKFWDEDFLTKVRTGEIKTFEPQNADHARFLHMMEESKAGKQLYDRQFLAAITKLKLDNEEDPTKPGLIFHKTNSDYYKHNTNIRILPPKRLLADLRKAA